MNLAVIGMQFGDEGKGKIVDFLSKDFDIVARFSGGSNAGHTVIYQGDKIKFHLIPSGVISGKIGVLGNGMVIDLKKLKMEIKTLYEYGIKGKIIISTRAHVVTELHRILDEQDDKIIGIGTTRQGIGPAYFSKTRRVGIQILDIFNEKVLRKKFSLLMNLSGMDIDDYKINEQVRELRAMATQIKDSVVDTEIWLNNAINSGSNVMFEGSQGSFLDMDFGTYPFVTSSNTTVGGISTGLGVPPQKIHRVMGITKAYTTRVGEGPFPTELNGDEAKMLRDRGNEYGVTTGRPRRVGWLDMPMLRYATMLNGVTELALTKVDVLTGLSEVQIASTYQCEGKETNYPSARMGECKPKYLTFNGWDNLKDENFINFIKYIERELKTHIKVISYGAERESTIVR